MNWELDKVLPKGPLAPTIGRPQFGMRVSPESGTMTGRIGAKPRRPLEDPFALIDQTANTAENVSLASRAGERMGHDDAPFEGIFNRSNLAPVVTFSGVFSGVAD